MNRKVTAGTLLCSLCFHERDLCGFLVFLEDVLCSLGPSKLRAFCSIYFVQHTFSIIEGPDEDEEIITEIPEIEVNVIPEETEMIKPSKNLSNYNVIDSLPPEEPRVILPPHSEQEISEGRDSDRKHIFRVFFLSKS